MAVLAAVPLVQVQVLSNLADRQLAVKVPLAVDLYM
jgi:hypothetical protein